MQNRRVPHRQRDRAFTDATGHDRQNQEEEDLERLQPQRHAHRHSYQHADNLTAQHRRENAQKALDQHLTVHAHNAANDNAADVEVQNIGRLIEFGGRFHHHVRQQAVMHQRRRNKGGADRRCPHFADQRQAFAKLAAGKTKERQCGNHDHDIAR
ncbi:hypothetical protein D3C78_1399040 [compost metagenome]